MRRFVNTLSEAEAVRVYEQLREDGRAPGIPAILSALKACSRTKNLQRGIDIHCFAREAGLDSHTFVANTLVDMYSKCGRLVEARQVFDKMARRDLVSWNAMIAGYAHNGHPQLALELLEQMREDGFTPNSRTFLAGLTACISLAEKEAITESGGRLLRAVSLAKALELHSQAQQEMDIFVANSLVDLYSHCGSMSDAHKVFERMPCHTVVSWTTLMKGYVENGEPEAALQLHQRMQLRDYPADAVAFTVALKACSALAAARGGAAQLEPLKLGTLIHSQAQRAGCASDPYVASTLVDVYSKCGSMVDARRVFESMPVQGVVSWNALISGYVDNGEPELALEMFHRFQKLATSPEPDAATFVAALRACAARAAQEQGVSIPGRIVKVHSLETGMAVHSQAVKSGELLCNSDVFLATTMVSMYSNCGSLRDARRVFDLSASHNVVLWNALILGYAENGEEELALELLASLTCVPNSLTFVAGLKACSNLAAKASERSEEEKDPRVFEEILGKGRSIHLRAAEDSRSLRDAFLTNALINMYVKCGSIAEASDVFHGLEHQNTVALNTLMLGFIDSGDPERALELFRAFRDSPPDAQSFAIALKACASSTSLEAARFIYDEACRLGLEITSSVATGFVDCFSKCGRMVVANQVFDRLPARDITTWNALMAGYSRQGESQQVLELFSALVDEGLEANGVTFVCVLTACSHAGDVDRAGKIFGAMMPRYGVAPGREHYLCMVDALGRVNRLGAAIELVRSMPFEANPVTWRTILAACKKWKNLEVGKLAFDSLKQLNCEEDPAARLLMKSI